MIIYYDSYIFLVILNKLESKFCKQERMINSLKKILYHQLYSLFLVYASHVHQDIHTCNGTIIALCQWINCGGKFTIEILSCLVWKCHCRDKMILWLIQYRDPILPTQEVSLWRYNDLTAVLYPQWDIPYWWNNSFISNQAPAYYNGSHAQ